MIRPMTDMADDGVREEPHQTNMLTHACTFVGMVTLLVYFITFSPFGDLSDPRRLTESVGNEGPLYFFAFCAVMIGAGCLYLRHLTASILVQITKCNLLLLAWLSLTVVLSSDPGTSLRRLALTDATFLVAAMLPWLVTGPRQLANLLIVAACVVLYLCYAGTALVPGLTIHQASDVVEPHLAGDWRGIYGYKNITAEVMAVFVFVFVFVIVGALVSISAFVFLLLSGGKSALGVLFLTAAIAFIVVRSQTLWMKALVAFVPLLLLAFLSIGTVVSNTAASILQLLPIDPTFTGRTDVWRFALEKISAKPITGHGFEAFWYSSAALFGSEDPTQWAGSAHTSHNGYLDLALTIGAPGLLLVLIAFLAVPLYHFHHAIQTAANRSLA